jgi:hypothetical protein
MEAVRTSETSICLNETTSRCVTESCHLHCYVHNVLKSSFPFRIPGQTVLQQLENNAGGRQLHIETRHYVCYSRNGNRITDENLGGHLARRRKTINAYK